MTQPNQTKWVTIWKTQSNNLIRHIMPLVRLKTSIQKKNHCLKFTIHNFISLALGKLASVQNTIKNTVDLSMDGKYNFIGSFLPIIGKLNFIYHFNGKFKSSVIAQL